MPYICTMSNGAKLWTDLEGEYYTLFEGDKAVELVECMSTMEDLEFADGGMGWWTATQQGESEHGHPCEVFYDFDTDEYPKTLGQLLNGVSSVKFKGIIENP